MARADILSILYSKDKNPLEFHFDALWHPSMYNYLTPQDIQSLCNIASSIKLSSKIELKYKEINNIMNNRGFKRFAGGTNRVVYNYLEDQSFLIKIGIDRIGMTDNPLEFKNQHLLKPFITKIFEVSQCGTVAMVERVSPITSRAEFASIANDVFNLLNTKILGKYILEDIGTKYFMNYGIRQGAFGPVLLDYPYLFELDDRKLRCNQLLETGEICGSTIDYDSGFNHLVCGKCGRTYLAHELKKAEENNLITIKGDHTLDLGIKIKRGDTVIYDASANRETKTIIIP